MSTPWFAIVAAAIIGASLGKPRQVRAKTSIPAPRSTGSLREIAEKVERETGINGFASFAEAAAWNESKLNAEAVNTSRSEAAAAARGYDGNLNRYGSSPFPRSRYVWGSGGWFGFLPSTALADRAWNNEDPLLVRDRVGSVVLLAAFVQRVVRNHFGNLPVQHRNWLTIRRFMGSNRRGYDFNEELEGTAGRRKRFARDYEAVGLEPDLMFQRVSAGSRRADPSLLAEILNQQQTRMQS